MDNYTEIAERLRQELASKFSEDDLSKMDIYLYYVEHLWQNYLVKLLVEPSVRAS